MGILAGLKRLGAGRCSKSRRALARARSTLTKTARTCSGSSRDLEKSNTLKPDLSLGRMEKGDARALKVEVWESAEVCRGSARAVSVKVKESARARAPQLLPKPPARVTSLPETLRNLIHYESESAKTTLGLRHQFVGLWPVLGLRIRVHCFVVVM